jgi:hypothetical protein
MKGNRCSVLVWALVWLLLAPIQVTYTAVGTAKVNNGPGQYISSTTKSGKSASTTSCLLSVTFTKTTTVIPTTTLVYEINSGEVYMRVTETNDAVAQLTPTTIYPRTVFTTAATSTSTVFYTPSSIIGTFLTITVPTSKGFMPIARTLPKKPAKRALGPLCIATTTVTRTVPNPFSTVTATSVTTLTGQFYVFEPFSTTFDDYGVSALISTFFPGYTGYQTVRAKPPRTITTSYSTTVFRTITLPTQTVTATTTTLYEACQSNNLDFGETIPVEGVADNPWWAATTPTIIPAGITPFDGYDVCCKAAFDYGGVAYYQYVPADLSCRVWRVADNNTCVQSATNITAALGSNLGTRVVGNGACGQITGTYYIPPTPDSED